MTDVVAREVAEQELERFAELMDIDLAKKLADEAARDERTRAESGRAESGRQDEAAGALAQSRELVIRAIMRGFATVAANGEIVYTPQAGGSALTFAEPTGDAFVSMKNDRSIGSMHIFMAKMAGVTPGTFAKLKQRDLKYCWAIALLFLAGS